MRGLWDGPLRHVVTTGGAEEVALFARLSFKKKLLDPTKDVAIRVGSLMARWLQRGTACMLAGTCAFVPLGPAPALRMSSADPGPSSSAAGPAGGRLTLIVCQGSSCKSFHRTPSSALIACPPVRTCLALVRSAR